MKVEKTPERRARDACADSDRGGEPSRSRRQGGQDGSVEENLAVAKADGKAEEAETDTGRNVRVRWPGHEHTDTDQGERELVQACDRRCRAKRRYL